MSSSIRIVVADDEAAYRTALQRTLNLMPECDLLCLCKDGFEALEFCSDNPPNVLLTDINMPRMNGIELIRRLCKLHKDISIVVLTVNEEDDVVFDALCAGACGYLVKKTPPARLLEAIKESFNGGSPMSSRIARLVISKFRETRELNIEESQYDLSSREKEVLNLLGEGSNYQEIANALFISVDTVRHHIRNIYKKLHVHSQSEAVAKAIRRGLI